MATDNYEIIQPPFTLKFREMSKKELKDYYRWFFQVSPLRLERLLRAVQSTPGFEDWKPNFKPNSLGALGRWFAAKVETRPRTQQEIDEIKGRSKFPIEISNRELTNETFSLAYDIGIYFAGVLKTNHPSLTWEQKLSGTRRYIDYGQPVLAGFGPVSLNPVRMMVTQAYGLVDGTWTGKRLFELYESWSEDVTMA